MWWAGEDPESAALVEEGQGPDVRSQWEAGDLACFLVRPPRAAPVPSGSEILFPLVSRPPPAGLPPLGEPSAAQLSPRMSCKGFLLAASRGSEVHSNSLMASPLPRQHPFLRLGDPSYSCAVTGGIVHMDNIIGTFSVRWGVSACLPKPITGVTSEQGTRPRRSGLIGPKGWEQSGHLTCAHSWKPHEEGQGHPTSSGPPWGALELSRAALDSHARQQ